MTWRSCVECGEPSPESRCAEHRLPEPAKSSRGARGYDAAWQQLSKRARRLQPFCSDCGTTDDLTTDHTPAAWQRRAEGKPIRLQDVDVCCRSCNAKRGRARPTGDGVDANAKHPWWKAKSPTHFGTQMGGTA